MILTNAKGEHLRYVSAAQYRKGLKKGKAPPVLMLVTKIPDDIKLAQQAIWALQPKVAAVAEAALRCEKRFGRR